MIMRNNRAVQAKHKNKNHRTHILSAGFVLLCIVGVFGALTYYLPKLTAAPAASQEASALLSTSTPAGPDAYANISLIGKAAIVYDLTNGQTLYAQDANESLPLASITKLLTLYAASGILSPSAEVTMTPQALASVNDAADNGFTIGESFTYEDIARLTLAASSNNGAEAIAEAADTAANTDTTTLLANAASQLGLSETHATNSSGLDISTTVSGGYGSAHDVAVLAGALLDRYPEIANATTLPSISITSIQGKVHSFANTDIDVTHFPDPLLSKTGYTDLAGGNLVVVYDAAINHPVAIVVLGSTEDGRFTDVAQLVRATLAHFAGTAAPAENTSGAVPAPQNTATATAP
jgi:D-alanyl-D-alanine carboxypeptidase